VVLGGQVAETFLGGGGHSSNIFIDAVLSGRVAGSLGQVLRDVSTRRHPLGKEILLKCAPVLHHIIL
jgi:hypothetical protein